MDASTAENRDSRDAGYRQLSFWLDTVPGTLAPRARLDADREVDVVIVGAGYTGLWTAWYLKQHAPELDITILEADVAGFGASGRNGGWASGYLSGICGWLENTQTRDSAQRLQRQMFQTVADIGQVCKDNDIDAHFAHNGHVEAGVNHWQMARMTEEAEHMAALGFASDFRLLSQEQVASRMDMHGARGGLFMPHCAAIHPARLVRGLAERLEASGVNLFEHSPVRALGPGFARTAQATVRAQQVLLATEGYTSRLGGLSRKLIPVHSMMVVTEPLDDAQRAATGLSERVCFNNLDHIVTYGQLTADGRIAFGCRGSYRLGSRIQSFNPTDDAFKLTRSKLLELFPGLEGVQFSHAWGGCMGVSRSLHPVVSFDARKGFGWAGGYFGNGVAAAHLAGQTLADLVLGRETDRVHTPWVNPPGEAHLRERLWEWEPLRWLGVRSKMQWMGWTDRLEHADSRWAKPFNRLLEEVFP